MAFAAANKGWFLRCLQTGLYLPTFTVATIAVMPAILLQLYVEIIARLEAPLLNRRNTTMAVLSEGVRDRCGALV